MVQFEDSLKIVSTFTTTKSFNAIRNFMDGNSVVNTINNMITEFMDGTDNAPVDPRFSPGWESILADVVLIENIDGVNNKWVAYKRLNISGDLLLTQEEYDQQMSDLMADIKADYGSGMSGQGYTDITFHLHYRDERAALGDEF